MTMRPNAGSAPGGEAGRDPHDTAPPAPAMTLAEAMQSRRSIRSYLPDPIPRATIEAILALASRAPSGSNAQPWHVHVVTGQSLARLSDALVTAFDDPVPGKYAAEYDYYPREWVTPYLERRRKVGWDLYSLVGIAKGDKAAMQAQHRRNHLFFDAPAALVFSIDRALSRGSWLDYGMFLQSVMLAARAFDLDTCPQASIVPYATVASQVLALPSEQMIVCAMSLGRANPDAVENSLVSEREPVAGFTQFHE